MSGTSKPTRPPVTGSRWIHVPSRKRLTVIDEIWVGDYGDLIIYRFDGPDEGVKGRLASEWPRIMTEDAP